MSGRFIIAGAVLLAAIAGCGGDDAGEADVDALKGVPWAVVSGIDAPGWESVAPTMTFSEGRFSGWDGCNLVGAPTRIDGGAMHIDTDRLHTTLKACAEPVRAVESAFLTALKRVATWGVADGTLTLRTEDGDEVLALKVPSVEGDWTANAINDGVDFSSTLPDVTITASFKDGTLSGSAGCNTYTATYRSERGAITIDPPTSTKKRCSAPEGVMEQEHKYLSALPRSTAYSVEGDGLSLHAADGTFVATLGRG